MKSTSPKKVRSGKGRYPEDRPVVLPDSTYSLEIKIMKNLQKPLVVARDRLRGTPLTLRLSGVALMVALLAGCDNSVAQNAAPPAPQVSAADVLIKQISQWDAFNGRVEAVQSVQLPPRVWLYRQSELSGRSGSEERSGAV